MDTILLYSAAAAWVICWLVIVYFYFAPCQHGCGVPSVLGAIDESGRSRFRRMFFELAFAFFFAPLGVIVIIQSTIQYRRAMRHELEAQEIEDA